MYIWEITKDMLHTPQLAQMGIKSSVGTKGPYRYAEKKAHLESLSMDDVEQIPFRLFDDDGNLYYEGILTIWKDALAEQLFAPLYDFGLPNAGCTRIDLFENGKWSPL